MTDTDRTELDHDWTAIPAKHRRKAKPDEPANDSDDPETAA